MNTSSSYSWNVVTFVIGNVCTVTAPSKTSQSYATGSSVSFGALIQCKRLLLIPDRTSFPHLDGDVWYDLTSWANNSGIYPSLLCKNVSLPEEGHIVLKYIKLRATLLFFFIGFVENRGNVYFGILSYMELLGATSTVFTYSWYFFMTVSPSVWMIATTPPSAQLQLSTECNWILHEPICTTGCFHNFILLRMRLVYGVRGVFVWRLWDYPVIKVFELLPNSWGSASMCTGSHTA